MIATTMAAVADDGFAPHLGRWYAMVDDLKADIPCGGHHGRDGWLCDLLLRALIATSGRPPCVFLADSGLGGFGRLSGTAIRSIRLSRPERTLTACGRVEPR